MSRTHFEKSEATVTRERYHLAERLINFAGSLSVRTGLPWTDLDLERLLASAMRRTGLRDFGDPRFRLGLDRVLKESQGRFAPLGTLLLRNLLHKALENRLRAVDYIRRHPEVVDLPIRRPIVILGFPRSGTTLLQSLLASTEDRAPLEFWELMTVTPKNEADARADKAARVRELERVLRIADIVVPELNRIHESSATSPEEDWQLLIPTFHALTFEFAYGLKGYGYWLRSEADMVWAYGEFKRMLQIILHQRPRRQLVLKCPDHLWFIDSLLHVFPDACIVQTHRDPVRCITSYTSMISLQERTLTGHINWRALARRITDHFLNGARRAHAARRQFSDRQFFDVPFAELVRDPCGIVRQVAEHFDLDPPPEQAVRAQLQKPRADRPGAHRYSYERLGLDLEDVRRRFRWYADAFAVETSAAA